MRLRTTVRADEQQQRWGAFEFIMDVVEKLLSRIRRKLTSIRVSRNIIFIFAYTTSMVQGLGRYRTMTPRLPPVIPQVVVRAILYIRGAYAKRIADFASEEAAHRTFFNLKVWAQELRYWNDVPVTLSHPPPTDVESDSSNNKSVVLPTVPVMSYNGIVSPTVPVVSGDIELVAVTSNDAESETKVTET